jgi:Putative DNA-binding domain
MKSSRGDREVDHTDDGMDLKNVQRTIYRLIAAPGGVDEAFTSETGLPPDGLDGLVVGEGLLPARDRLEIYANAYFYRLLDVFKEEFPATLAVVGEVNFHNLITGYLIDYPPTEPSILHAGRHLPDFIRAHPLSERWRYIGDLALLERTTLEIFHAPDAPVLDAATMRQAPPHEWPRIVMKAHPASRILETKWRVDKTLHAIEVGEPWSDPESGPASVIVWRQNSKVNYRVMDRAERAALEVARAGAAFESICEVISAEADGDEDPAALINRLLTRWLSDGLIVREG